ncbi:MAG: PKD domain-containing protein [Bacteroidales bacterium]|nr:PKD domain-containing protein [Bacteroidales bacterium]
MRKLLLGIILMLLYAGSAFGQCSTTADYSYAYTGCSTIQFSDASTTSAGYTLVTWRWNFGDGDTATLQNPTHTFAPGANVQVRLIVQAQDTLGNSCYDTITKSISLRTLPEVYIASLPNPACLNDSIRFTGNSNHPIQSWQWIFGDGDTVNIQNPVHQYADTGSYNVILHVLDASGCANDTTVVQKINPVPTVDFTWSPNPVTTATNIQFNATSNATSTATTMSWHWDFGDGDTANVQNPTHNFAVAGQYTVRLNIEVDGVCTNTLSKVITINPLPTVNFTYAYLSCSRIQFTDASAAAPNYTLVKWTWNFGDGNTATGPDVAHTFTPGSNVRVSLVVTSQDTLGNFYVDSTFQNISIRSLPTVEIQSNPNPACVQIAPQFYGTSNHMIQSWQWIFGDGDTANVQNPAHLYADTGSYTVSLHVMDASGCANDTTYPQRIDLNPSVDFTWSPDPATTMDNIQFNGTSNAASTATTIAWHWDFGDGDTANVQNPTHRYSVAGQDTVTLTVTVDGLCSSTIQKVVTVYPYVIPNFTYSVSCLNDITYFTDSSVTATGTTIATWKWYFGDGDSTIINSPNSPNTTHVYVTAATYPVTLVTVTTTGFERRVTKDVTVVQKPTAFFTYDTTCYRTPTSFYDRSSTNGGSAINSWHWTFGDGDSANVQNPMHTYAYPGSYPITLYIQNTDGCRDTVQRVMVMDTLPAVDFTMSTDTVCQNGSITFSGQATNISSWYWDFGNGTTSIYQNATAQFTTPGIDTITLTVTDLKGCTSSVFHTVYVRPGPAAGFNFDILCHNDTTCFWDTSAIPLPGYLAAWHWNFGDGDTSNIQNPEHYYVPDTNYTARLTVTSNEGCENTATHLIIFDSLPVPDFNISNACMNDNTHFTDVSTSPGSPVISHITTRKWYFGDGDSLIVTNPNVSTADHIYRVTTTYDVKLVVSNSFGKTDSITKRISVHHKPLADFTFNDTCFNQPISFTDLSKTDGGSALAAWNWNFGDPHSGILNTDTLQNPMHVMTDTGSYQVQMIVTNTDACSDTLMKTVVVNPLPPVSFTVQKDSMCLGDQAYFYGVGSNITSWHWDFGNGDTSLYQNPVYKYPHPGTYVVTLTVKDLQGCTNFVADTVFVDGGPKADFTIGASCMGDSVHFNDATTQQGFITQWQWNFGDTVSASNQSSLENPAHYFTAAGTYTTRLVVTDNYGCKDSTSHFVNVYDHPKAAFSFHQACDPTTQVDFTDQSVRSTSKSPITSYLWTFYQADTSHLQNPSYQFPHYDSCFQVTLAVTDTNGCQNTDTVQVCLRDSLTVDFTMTQVCQGNQTMFAAAYNPSNDSISAYTWNFGDGSSEVTTYNDTVYHVFPRPGTYNVVLSALDTNGCTVSISHTAVVDSLPQVDFTYSKPSCDQPLSFYSNSRSANGYIMQWKWDFGDTASVDNQSTVENPVHRFTSVGAYSTRLVVTDNYGCTDTVSHFVDVYGRPNAAFTYKQACSPATQIDFTDQSTRSVNNSPIDSYTWEFYQGDSSHLQNPSYRFPMVSCYQVILTVADTNGCTDADTVQVCLRDSLSINFSTSSPSVCQGNRMGFTANYNPYNDSIAAYTWNFGDGSAGVITYHDTVSHIFPRPGTYNVVLSALDTNGCTVSVSHQAVVDSLPLPDFTYTTPSCDQPTYFNGTTLSGGNFIRSWSWNFGDVTSGTANTATVWNPNHLYPSGDSTYQVKLIVTNFNGCTDSVTKPVVRTSCLDVFYTVNTPTGCALNPVYFRDHTVLGSSLGSINNWYWDFGDGQTETYTAFRDSLLHVYSSAGSYNVILRVTATVNGVPFTTTYDSTIHIYRPPVADFVFSKACTNQLVQFTDSTKIYDANLNQWQWSFNDPFSASNTSGVKNPVHLYDSTGTFNTRLIVTDNNNCSDTVTKPVEVHITPVAAFTMNYNYDGVTGQILFDNTSTDASTYFWNFGDGNTSTEVSPVYRYSSVGIFTILLTATSDYYCVDTASAVYDLTSGLYVPNSFAPGLDKPGVNTFLPKGIHLKEYEVQVFSPWGNLLWESTKLNANGEPVEGWDGTYKGQPMPSGEYIWRIKAKFLNDSVWRGSDNGDGNVKPYGSVFLIR